MAELIWTPVRFNTKLAEHYDAIANALSLARDDVDELERFVNILSPSGIDFGKPPSYPTEEVLSLVKGLVDKQKTVP